MTQGPASSTTPASQTGDAALAHDTTQTRTPEMTTTTDLQTHFETSGPISLKIEVHQGDITLTTHEADPADATGTTVRLVPRGRHGEEIAAAFTVQARGDDVVVIAPKARDTAFGFGSRGSVDVHVALPAGSTIDARTGSGDVSAHGRLATVHATTGSGDLTFEDVESARLKSGSGDITARAVSGSVDAKTGSGDITLESATEAVDLVSGSGDIQLRRAQGDVKAKSGSGDLGIGSSSGDLDLMTGTGDVKLGAVHGGTVRAKTGTGDVMIAVAHGVAAYLDLNTVTGEVKIDLDDADGPDGSESQARLTVHSGSGDIRVARAKENLS